MTTATSPEFGSVGIVGGGFMGTGIAQVVACAGLSVTLVENGPELAEQAAERVRESLAREVQHERLASAAAAAAAARIATSPDLAAIAACDLVIEAVTEDLETKLGVFARLGEIADVEAVLATNTSSIPVSELAAVVPDPHRVVGLHFFSPVPRMPLVEIVKTLRTDDDTCQRVFRFVAHLGKEHIETKDRSGFVVNFLLIPYLLSAMRLFEDGFASRDDIDTGMSLGCGHPMGPLRLADLIGLDVILAVAQSLHAEFGRPEYSAPPLLRRMVSLGLLGRKSEAGFYGYSPDA